MRASVALNGMKCNSQLRGPQATFLCAEARAPRQGFPRAGAPLSANKKGRPEVARGDRADAEPESSADVSMSEGVRTYPPAGRRMIPT